VTALALIRQKRDGADFPSGAARWRRPTATEVEMDERRRGQHQHSRAGITLVWSAVIACPCHWPLLVLGLFGAPVAGTLLHSHFQLIVALATLYFAATIPAGLWLLHRGKRSCTRRHEVRPGARLGTNP